MDEDQVYLAQYICGTFLSLSVGAGCFAFCVRYVVFHAADRRLYKHTVAIAAFLTIFHMTLVLGDAILAFAMHFGDLDWAEGVSLPYALFEGVNSIMAGLVLAFYSWRVYVMYQQRIWLSVVLALFLSFTVASGVWTAVQLYRARSGEYDNNARYQILSYVSAVVNDALISAAMLVYFARIRKKGIAASSGRILLRLAILTISTNAFTTLVTIAAMVSFITGSGGDAVLDPVLGHCYTITLLTWLVSRSKETGATSVNRTSRLPTSHLNKTSPYAFKRRTQPGLPTRNSITVETETEIVVSEPNSDAIEITSEVAAADGTRNLGIVRIAPFLIDDVKDEN